MKACLSFSDIVEFGRPQIDEMKRVGDSYPGPETPEACIAFTRQVNMGEGIVLQTYKVSATLARKTDDLGEVAEIWSKMSQFCHCALQVLAGLKDKYPHCGTNELYDLVLDYKLAADKRYKGVSEELACQKTEFPKGLLPELS